MNPLDHTRHALAESGLIADVDSLSDEVLLQRTAQLVFDAYITEAPVGVPDGHAIAAACFTIGGLLLAKNKAYGGSALAPLAVFSDASVRERLAVRMDDKVARLARGNEVASEDATLDLAGYLILLLAHSMPETTATIL